MRKDAKEIIKRLSRLPVTLTLTTNGLLLHEYIDDILQANIKSINVSIDSLKEDKFEMITRRNCLEKVIENIHLLLQHDFSVKLNIVCIKGFNDDDWQRIKSDWVEIASQIHKNVTIEKAREMNMPNFIEPGPSAAERIFDLSGVEEDVLAFANKIINESKSLDLDNLHYVLIHNDLQFHNIIADPKTKRITGLIDWTDACIGPLAREFAIGEWMKPGLLEEVAELYESKNGFKVDCDEARMWRSLEELGDYVESTEAGDLDDALDTLGRIRNMMELTD